MPAAQETLTANWSFSLINGCMVWGAPQRKVLQHRPGPVSARLPRPERAGEWSQGPPVTLKTSPSVAQRASSQMTGGTKHSGNLPVTG